MYGTIAKLKVAPGKLDELLKLTSEYDRLDIPGMQWTYVYQSDEDPNVCWIAVGFKDQASYKANAGSPDQNARYEKMRALLAADPQWHDGMVVQAVT